MTFKYEVRVYIESEDENEAGRAAHDVSELLQSADDAAELATVSWVWIEGP